MYIIICVLYGCVDGFTTPKNIKIPSSEVVITPVNNTDSYMKLIGNEDDFEIVMEKTNGVSHVDKKDSAIFAREKGCNGYSLYLNNNKICFNHDTEKLVLCKDKNKDFMLWDVQQADGGLSICTAQSYNFVFVDYNYEYCITISDEKNSNNDMKVKAEYSRQGHVNQLFDIYNMKTKTKI